ncbi:transporter family protein [Jannaschia faecimaris]|uniref:Transporter family protein n=1 Tax=Jannaschia faecimaris TaxID=1244108 RepID=A0A1H3NS93_9RHOB|nr:EamA family transporter [Jannaschia faecimaris]SDY91295.1 transporter family protein [Jannaschia faecimaris]
MATLLTGSWQFWAVLAAVFAALTAIFAKVGVADINSDLATLIRTLVVLLALAALVWGTGKMQNLSTISPRTWLFLVLSGLATGASWLCYFRAMQLGDASRVAPVDKLSVVFVAVIAVTVLGEQLSPLAWVGVGLIGSGAVLLALAP